MNCNEILKRYQLYLDRELKEDLYSSFRQHLQNCPRCQNRITFESRLRKIICSKIRIQKAPEQLRDRIRNQLF